MKYILIAAILGVLLAGHGFAQTTTNNLPCPTEITNCRNNNSCLTILNSVQSCIQQCTNANGQAFAAFTFATGQTNALNGNQQTQSCVFSCFRDGGGVDTENIDLTNAQYISMRNCYVSKGYTQIASMLTKSTVASTNCTTQLTTCVNDFSCQNEEVDNLDCINGCTQDANQSLCNLNCRLTDTQSQNYKSLFACVFSLGKAECQNLSLDCLTDQTCRDKLNSLNSTITNCTATNNVCSINAITENISETDDQEDKFRQYVECNYKDRIDRATAAVVGRYTGAQKVCEQETLDCKEKLNCLNDFLLFDQCARLSNNTNVCSKFVGLERNPANANETDVRQAWIDCMSICENMILSNSTNTNNENTSFGSDTFNNLDSCIRNLNNNNGTNNNNSANMMAISQLIGVLALVLIFAL